MKANIVKGLGKLVVCLLILAAISVSRDKRLMGHDVCGTDTSAVSDTATISMKGGIITVNSLNIGSDIVGYAGSTPLKIYISGNRIDSIGVLPNNETPEFFERVTEEILPQYYGKEIDIAMSMNVDAVTGATYSSEAVKATVKRSLSAVSDFTENYESTTSWGVKPLLVLLVAISAAVLPLIVRNRRYRIVQLLLNIAVMGIYAGTFVSYSSLVSILSNGLMWQSVATFVLIVTAFIYPLLGRKSHYCAWCCPLGSAQEMAGMLYKHKLMLGKKWRKGLRLFRQVLWCVLMILAWSGIFFEWMDYELFSAFLWESASWIMLVFAFITLLTSVFIHRPYCRFVCPTGTLLKILN
ncbi:MAG: FMN-binding protein [Prevotella sp.]